MMYFERLLEPFQWQAEAVSRSSDAHPALSASLSRGPALLSWLRKKPANAQYMRYVHVHMLINMSFFLLVEHNEQLQAAF
jgi:hypothetical protein